MLKSGRGAAPDVNVAAAGLLQDMALLQSSERSRFGYKRAAKMIATGIDRPVDELVAEGALREIPFVGPSSARIVSEFVTTGRSDTVERALDASTRRADVLKRRTFRRAYLSRQAMLRALSARRPRGIVSRAVYKGDLQMHSTWSDGVETIASLAEAGLALGYTRLGLTDHSYGLPIARGMSMENARAQGREIDALNARLSGRLRVYKGVEANILADGSLDLDADERRVFEYIVASPHSLLRRDTDQTMRMINAVRQPGVAILGHPQGRMYNTRPGVTADWPRVFREAAARGVAIELDGNWHRQDIDHELAREALALGCLFALDSDAHSIGELPFTDYAIAHARIAGIPADRIVNCWEDARFDAWLADRR
ncbi:MAG TPA: PHP domain-containing protein [Vicinamibacterales bacterium]|nr:PHP domain-containing protein [Vicinamibacterales bacterium]